MDGDCHPARWSAVTSASLLRQRQGDARRVPRQELFLAGKFSHFANKAMAKHYSQAEKHRYVWYCVQGITNLEYRRREVARLAEKHQLSDEQLAKLEEWFASLDSRRQERQRQAQERARVSPVEYAIAHPTRQNLLDLRSGRDRFSKIRLAPLRDMAGVQPEIDNSHRCDADKAAAYRWVLRGLPASLAMRKVVYAGELAERLENRRHSFDVEDEEVQFRAWEDELKERQAEERREREERERRAQDSNQANQITTYLAGAKYYDTSNAVVGPVEIVWEPTNPHDPNAIKITQRGIHLGYVPKDIAPRIRNGSTARLAAVGYPWTVIIDQPKSFSFVLPKLLVGLP
jgi:HIRAN domain